MDMKRLNNFFANIFWTIISYLNKIFKIRKMYRGFVYKCKYYMVGRHHNFARKIKNKKKTQFRIGLYPTYSNVFMHRIHILLYYVILAPCG